MSMIDNDWLPAIQGEFRKPYYRELYTFVREEYSRTVVYPPAEDIFNAFHFTPLSEVKVLLLGQDPYHNVNQAHGLSFSVLPEQKEIPPSLQNIYKELHDDLGCYIPNNGYLKNGRSGSASAQHGAYGARAPGEFPSGKRLGTVHRCGHSGSKCPGSSDCVPPLGQTGAVQNTDAYESEAPDLNGTASESSLGIPGIFRVPAFQQGKCVS
mgnify:CR=1 FL=1